VALAGGACSGAPAPATPPTPVAATPAPATPEASAPVWRAGRSTYDYTAAATIVLEGDTSRAGERVSTVALLTLDVGGTAPRLRGTVTVDSFAVGGSARVGPGERLRSPIRIDATHDPRDGAVRFDGHLPPDCASAATSARLVARSILVPLPRSLAPGTTWSDTTTTESCRGGLLIRTRTDARYTLDGADERATPELLRVSRRLTAQLDGVPSLGGQGPVLRGSMSGSARLALDRRTGRLISLDGQSTTELELTVGARTQKMRQAATERIAAKP
jgi:hypothetical protein